MTRIMYQHLYVICLFLISSRAQLLEEVIQPLLDQCSDTALTDVSLSSRQAVIFPFLFLNSSLQATPLSSAYNKTSKKYQMKPMLGFRYLNKTYHIKLLLNSKISPTQNSSRSRNSYGTTVDLQISKSCYYQGVFTNPDSLDDYVALSMCSGVSGVMRINKKLYSIKPFDSSKNSELCWLHVLTETQHMTSQSCTTTVSQWETLSQLHSAEYYSRLSSVSRRKIKRNLESKILKIAYVVDFNLSGLFLHNTTRIREYLLEMTNLLDLYYQRLNIRVSLVSYKIWSSQNNIPVVANARETLQSFTNFIESKATGRPYDVIHLLSGIRFEDNSIGLAIPDSICTDRAIAVISAETSDITKLSSIVAHMVGHNLGLQHDSPDCECKDSSGTCIMSNSIGDEVPYLFSSCSSHRLQLLTKVGLGQCLNSQSAVQTYPQRCGNGVVERGEQCDTGPQLSPGKADPCCNSTTCLLKSWATCKSGECCSNCLPKETKSLCRAAIDDCDAPEYCDGVHGECPMDYKIQDGQPCDDETGFCYQGRCPSRTQQCKLLWGDLSTSSSDNCYIYHNVKGNVLGHCGETIEGYYRRCPARDAFCGSLQCHGGEDVPIVYDVDYRKTSTNEHTGVEEEITCKTVNSKSSSDYSVTGMVMDGTKCGQHHLCQSHQCISIESLHTPGCPVSPSTNTTCAGKGRCTSDRKCFCNPGYTGESCDIVVPQLTTSEPFSNSADIKRDKAENTSPISRGAVVGLALTVLFLIGAPFLTIFMYKRKMACLKKRKEAVDQDKLQENSEIVTHNFPNAVPQEVCYTIPSSQQNFCGRRQRRRRRRYHSSSSDNSTDEDYGNESDLPCVIYEVPLTDQPKGILKKSTFGFDHSECSDSQCSCGEYSSAESINCNEERVRFIESRNFKSKEDRLSLSSGYRLPRPDEDCSLDGASANKDLRSTQSMNHNEYELRPEELYGVNEIEYMATCHDSASDSAIDLPKGDSSTHSESSAINRGSPQSNILRPVNQPTASNFCSTANRLDNYNDRATPRSQLDKSQILPPPAKYSLEPHKLTDDTEETQALLYKPKTNETTHLGSMYSSVRPNQGVMSTFKPISEQTIIVEHEV